MSVRQVFYLALSCAGLLLTWYHNIAFMQAYGSAFVLGPFLDGMFANHASSSISWDLTIGCTAFIIWMLHEAKTIGMKHVWIYVVLTLGIAFAFAAPLFLFMRERHLLMRERDATAHIVSSAAHNG